MIQLAYTPDDVLKYLDLAEKVLADFSRGGYRLLISPTNSESQPMACGVYSRLFAGDKDVELVIRHRNRILTLPSKGLRPDRPARLIVTDDVQTPATIEELKEAYEGLKKSSGVEEILYLTKTLGEHLYTEFIPQRQTAQDAGSQAAAQ